MTDPTHADHTRGGTHSRSLRRSASIGLIAGLLLSMGTAAAVAGYAQSTLGTFTSGGINYTNASDILTKTGTDSSGSLVKRTNGTASPAGHIGAMARGYRSSGALACSSGYLYSGSSSVSFLAACNFSGTLGASYYGHGISKTWTGSAYDATYTFKSPNQTA